MSSKFEDIDIGATSSRRITFDQDITGYQVFVGIKKDLDDVGYVISAFAALDPPDENDEVFGAVWELPPAETSKLSPGKYWAEEMIQTEDRTWQQSMFGAQRFIAKGRVIE